MCYVGEIYKSKKVYFIYKALKKRYQIVTKKRIKFHKNIFIPFSGTSTVSKNDTKFIQHKTLNEFFEFEYKYITLYIML